MSGKKDIQEKESEVEVEYTNKPEGDYSEINNNAEVGGYYPFGENGFWHSGVHVKCGEIQGINKVKDKLSNAEEETYVNPDNAVKPIMNGKIVAYRMEKDYQYIPLRDKINFTDYSKLSSDFKTCYYLNKKGVYELNNKNSEDETISRNFFLLEHEVGNGLLKFYTMYYNLLSDQTRLKKYKSYSNEINTVYKQIKPFYKTYAIEVTPNEYCEVKYVKGTNLVPGSKIKSNIKIKGKELLEYKSTGKNFILHDCMTNVKENVSMMVHPDKKSDPNKIDVPCKNISSEYVNLQTVFVKNIKLNRLESNKIYGEEGYFDVKQIGEYTITKEIAYDQFCSNPILENDNSNVKFNTDFTSPTYLIPIDFVEQNPKKEKPADNLLYHKRYPINGREVYRIVQKAENKINETNRPLHYVDITNSVKKNIKDIVFIITEKDISSLYDNNKNIINFEYDKLGLINDFKIIEKNKDDKTEIQYSDSKYCICYYPNIDDKRRKSLKIFWKGHEITPLTINNDEFLNAFSSDIKMKKKLAKEIKEESLIVFEVEPTIVNKLDSFLEFDIKQYGKNLIQIKENSKYYLCNRCIQPELKLNYAIDNQDCDVDSLEGVVKTDVIDVVVQTNQICFRASSDEKSTPLVIFTGKDDFYYDSKPVTYTKEIKTGKKDPESITIDICKFNNFQYRNNTYFANIPEECIKIAIVDNPDIVSKSVQDIPFLGEVKDNNIEKNENIVLLKEGYPVTSNTILGQAFYDLKYDKCWSYYDVCMFMNKELPDKSQFNQKYLFYKKVNKSNVICKDINKDFTVHLPIGTQVEFEEMAISSNSKYLKVRIKKIPVFIKEALYLQSDFLGIKELIDTPDYFLLSDTKILHNKNSDKVNDYMSKLFYLNIKKLINKNYEAFEYTKNEIGVNIKTEDIGCSQVYYCYGNGFSELFGKGMFIRLTNDYKQVRLFNKNPMNANLNNSIALYLPKKTMIQCLDIFNYNNVNIYMIKIKSIPVYISKKCFKKTYRLKKDCYDFYLNNTNIETYKQNATYKQFYDKFCNFRVNKINIYEEFLAKENNTNKDFAGIYVDTSILMLNKDFWIDRNVASNYFELINKSENFIYSFKQKPQNRTYKSNIELKSLELFEKNPEYIYCSEKVLKDNIEITKIDNQKTIKSNTGKEYFSITVKDDANKYYIKKEDLLKFSDDATDWPKYFNETIEDEDIEIPVFKEIKDQLKLTKEEVERCKNYELIQNIYDESEYNKNIIKNFRKAVVKHPHEWDAKGYEKLDESKPKILYAKNYSKNAEIIGKLSSLGFSSDKLLTYYHPFYFYNHIKAAGMLEFNPYLDFKNYNGIYNTQNGTCVGIDMKTEIVDNPGFAPVYDNYHEKNINGYAGANAFYNEDYSMYYKSTRYYMYHEGVDFAGKWKKGEKGTPIKAFITCEVVAWGDFGAYGNALFMRNLRGKGFYLLGHLSEYASDIAEKKQYSPGDIVGYVGNTGNCFGINTQADRDNGNGAHLHLSYYDYQGTGKEAIGTGNTVKIMKKDYIDKLRNPFNHNSEPWKGTKWK